MTEIVRISRVVADLDRAQDFYQHALTFRPVAREPVDDAVAAALGIGRAEQAPLWLGAQQIALVRCEQPGRDYPADSRSNDLWFQHLAIVVSDMDAAYAHLTAHAGWRAISEGGPVTLPVANDGVRAFKFRDPDGHPLELIWFPPGVGREVWRPHGVAGLFLGIDHTAVAVASTSRAVPFYSGLGFAVSARSQNDSPEQSRLDGFADAKARITALRPPASDGPGVELLGYDPPGRETPAPSSSVPWPSSSVPSPSSSGSTRGSARTRSVPDLRARVPHNELPGPSPGMTVRCTTDVATPDSGTTYDWPAPDLSPRATDIATDWVTLSGGFGATPRAISDPDGHLLLLLDQGRGSPA